MNATLFVVLLASVLIFAASLYVPPFWILNCLIPVAWIIAYPYILGDPRVGAYIGMSVLVAAIMFTAFIIAVFVLPKFHWMYLWKNHIPSMFVVAYALTIASSIAFFVIYSRFAATYQVSERQENMCIKQPLEKETVRWNLRQYNVLSKPSYMIFAAMSIIVIVLVSVILALNFTTTDYLSFALPSIALLVGWIILLGTIHKNAIITTLAPTSYIMSIQGIAKFMHTCHINKYDQQVKFEPLRTSILRNIQSYHNMVQPMDAERMYVDMVSDPESVEIVGYMRLLKDQYDYERLNTLSNDVFTTIAAAPVTSETKDGTVIGEDDVLHSGFSQSKTLTDDLKKALDSFALMSPALWDPKMEFANISKSVNVSMIAILLILGYIIFHVMYKDLKMDLLIPIGLLVVFVVVTWKYTIDMAM